MQLRGRMYIISGHIVSVQIANGSLDDIAHVFFDDSSFMQFLPGQVMQDARKSAGGKLLFPGEAGPHLKRLPAIDGKLFRSDLSFMLFIEHGGIVF